jgi:hypothetical protein
MPVASPFELLAEELGAVAGRIERESASKIAALVADVGRRFAEHELQIERLQKALEGAIAQRINVWDQLINDKLSSLCDGEDGLPGKDGIDGEDGAPGKDGIDGKDGLQGVPGKDGAAGAAGQDGAAGSAGVDGKDGKDGSNGKDGVAGKLPKVRVWKEGVWYDGDVVRHVGGTYQAERDTAATPGSSVDWICLAAAGLDGEDGKDGADGKSLTIRETFDPTHKYSALDVVTLDHKWFVAKVDDPGMCPGPGWKAGPGIGRTGKPGEPGPRGEQGPAGAMITEWEIQAKTFEAIPIMSDGTAGSPLQLRELFEQFQMEGGDAF